MYLQTSRLFSYTSDGHSAPHLLNCCLYSRQKDWLEKLLRPSKEACKAPSQWPLLQVKENISQYITNSLCTDTLLCFFAFLIGFLIRLLCTIYSCHAPQIAHRFSHQNQVLLNLFSILKLMWLSVLYLQHGETNTAFCSRTEQEQYFIFKISFSLDEGALHYY